MPAKKKGGEQRAGGEQEVVSAAERSEQGAAEGRPARRSYGLDGLFWTVCAVIMWSAVLYHTAVKHETYRQRLREGKMYVKDLKPGWFFGLPMDLSDDQWRILRKFIPALLVGMVVHVTLSAGARMAHPAANRLFYIVSNLGFVYFLHGSGTVWVLLIAALSYAIGRVFKGSRLNPLCTWVLCILAKGLSDYHRGFQRVRFRRALGPWGGAIDAYGGVYAWQTQFNLTFLRLVSYNMEFYWTCRQGGDEQRARAPGGDAEEGGAGAEAGGGGGKGGKRQVDALVGAEMFSLVNFLAYVFYIPLYIAGPISPFNRWVSQAAAPRPVLTAAQWATSMLKLCAYTVVMEVGLHLWYYVSINNNRHWAHSVEVMQGWEVAWGGLFTLQFMYLKFLIIWRFFRTWSMADGIDVPENMGRCVNNNFTFEGFWRQWHGSLNKWIVKYLYVPLGGSKTQAWSIWVIFTFIGLWHDLMWRWLAWAWCNCVFFSAEMGLFRLARAQFLQPWKASAAWEYIVGCAGAVNIHFLIVANLAIMHGFEGSAHFARSVFTEKAGESNGSMSALGITWTFFFINQLGMQAIRRREAMRNNAKRF